MHSSETQETLTGLEIAIVGLAGRMPGAANPDAFWRNLRDGVEAISFFTEEELRGSGLSEAEFRDPLYVPANGVLDGIESFDAGFFGFYPREAEILDPQHRIFLECAWEALENAGYDPARYPGAIGVFAGAGMNRYLLDHLLPSPHIMETVQFYQLTISNEKDFLPTRVSYKLNLRGPSINVQTGCSTSLVAVHLACQGLLNYQCDMALAGGVTIRLPQAAGYRYQEGSIGSPDGHCRAFDAKAQGTVGGSGVGIVVLKRLADAIADGDCIHAVIKGSAINNDGSNKVGFTAPSVEGQAEAIANAQALAGVEARTISYIEAHGTGTALGDPIEIAALTEAFRAGTDARGFCAIGSVKTNIGHLDAAAGVTGLIKTTLALKHRMLPPSLHYEQSNPKIDFADSPFYVNSTLKPWQANGTPLRAGVSSFGIGGTNAHVIVEEAPRPEASSASRPAQLLLLSARRGAALETATANLAKHLRENPSLDLADVAHTLQVGRQPFSHRRILVCQTMPGAAGMEDAVKLLEGGDPSRVFTSVNEAADRPVVFMFSGQGSQYVNMARGLYREEAASFRRQIDYCSELLTTHLGLDLREVLFPAQDQIEEEADELAQTWLTQPALFAIEYALAQLWIEWGVRPAAMIGHSIGEYVAACIAGVFSLEDALALVAARGQMMQDLPAGAMTSVPMSETDLRPLLGGKLSLAAVNGPRSCVVAGPFEAVDEFERAIAARGVEGRRLHTSHAFHSLMMEPILDDFARQVSRVTFNSPAIPFISNVTGAWITAEEATDAGYWARQLRQGVRFADGTGRLLEDPSRILLEVGPGQTLTTLARQHPAFTRDSVALTSLRPPHDQDDLADNVHLLTTLGRLWLAGVTVDWQGFYQHERRMRLPLPTYPFERQRYWIERRAERPGARSEERGARSEAEVSALPGKRADIAEWFYLPSWRRDDGRAEASGAGGRWLIFRDTAGLGDGIARELEDKRQQVSTVLENAPDYQTLLQTLSDTGQMPDSIVLCRGAFVVPPSGGSVGLRDIPNHRMLPPESGTTNNFHNLLGLVQAVAKLKIVAPLRIFVITNSALEVTGEETLAPAQAMALGLAKVIPQEFPNITCRSIDLETRASLPALVADMLSESNDAVVAYRGRHRWVQCFEPVRLPANLAPAPRLKEGGVYLITGGLGRIGLALARHLAKTVRARLVLVGRTASLEARASLPALEALGAEVMVASADVADVEQMKSVIAAAESRFGALNGVIHSAGVTGDEAMKLIEQTTPEDVARQFRPKVEGVIALDEALGDRDLDFCILQSSLSSVLGGLSFGVYAAANHFMDAYAQMKRKAGAPQVLWMSVNWDGWRFEQEAQATGAVAEMAMTPEEGVAAFERVLGLEGAAQVVVSTGDLQARLRQWVNPAAGVDLCVRPESEGHYHQRPGLATAYVAPRSEYEEQIVGMWREVLGIDEIGVHDNFFELGGHSLLATQIVSRLRDLYQVELPLRRLFEAPTVAGLAAIIECQQDAGAPVAPTVQAIPAISRDGVLPLSFAQQRLWFLDQFDPGSPLYNNPAAIRLSGELDVAAFERSLNLIVARHEVLRAVFTEEQGKPVQTILPELTLRVRMMDLGDLAEPEAEVRRLAGEEAVRSFDLARGPLLRVVLLRLEPREHVALMTMHHIVSDGWSLGALIRELAEAYAALIGSREPKLPVLPIQYADFAHWQHDWLRGDVLATQLDYWKRRIGDASVVLELPTDRPRPAMQTFRGQTQWLQLPGKLTRDLEALARRPAPELGGATDATLFMVLMAAFQTLMHRYTGQEQIRVGSPVAGRRWAETEGLIGCFINPLVMCSDFREDPTFRDLLRQVRETALEAYAHQDLPFEMLVEALAPERSLSHSPLFQAMLVLQNAPAEQLNLPGLTGREMKPDRGTEKFDLTLFAEEDPSGLRLGWSYNTDLFDAATITRMAAHFETLLAGVVADPDARISQLPLLPEAERMLVLETWNDTATDDGQAPLVHRLVEAQVARTPDEIAVVCGPRSLTYAELNRRANQLARHLRALGVGPELVVGACIDRSIEMVVALLGVLKAGGVWLPLDPDSPAERLRFMLEDADVRVLLTRQSVEDRGTIPRASASGGLHTLRLDVDWERVAHEDESDLDHDLRPGHLAYVIYTSGSTGRPKGVLVEHGTLANHCRDMQRHYRLTPADRVLQFASLNFDPSLEQILSTLMAGARLVLREGDAPAAAEFNRMVVEQELSVVNIPPAYWHQWANWAAEAGGDAGALASAARLRLVIIGGDAMLPETLSMWRRTPMSRARLLNAYGPTETTITATTYEVPQQSEAPARLPIGRPLANRKAYLLDANGQPVPIGVAGELHLGGAGLARGYLNHPELTAERFVDLRIEDRGSRIDDSNSQSSILNPQSSIRVYRTGDLARYLPDGNIEFLGRRDHQVKIRGFRVELGEIEAALATHPAVRAAAVMARTAADGNKRLAAFIVPDSTETFDTAAIRAFLKSKLPDYMTPSLFLTLDALPLTTGGKVDRRALASMEVAPQSDVERYVAPRTGVEEEIARIWAGVLGLERVGVTDNFFELGGHSLLATQVIARVREAFATELPLRALFESPTVEGMALLITERQAEAVDSATIERLLAELEALPEEEAPDPDRNVRQSSVGR